MSNYLLKDNNITDAKMPNSRTIIYSVPYWTTALSARLCHCVIRKHGNFESNIENVIRETGA